MAPHEVRVIDGNAVCQGRCPVTGKDWQVIVPVYQYNLWAKGELIQQAMPGLSAEQRELLISGTSPEGWEILFGGPDA